MASAPMTKAWLAALVAMALGAGAARAEPAKIALVLGNGAYGAPALPNAPACPATARSIGETLRGLGFAVTERMDLTRGGMDAAVAGFGRAIREAPGAVAVVYACGHVAAMGNRGFLLPSGATLERETDVLTQGLLARLLPDALQRNGASAGLVAIDALSRPGAVGTEPAFPPLAEAAAALGMAMVVARADPAMAPPTPLGAALVAELAGPQVTLARLAAGLRRRLPADGVEALAVPAKEAYLAGAPAPAAPPPAAAVAAPAPPAAPSALPEESAMDDATRREVQSALGRLGYYAGQPDGVFGANTRAAIRRFQHEIGVPMTGTLTGPQATRLVQGR